MTLGKKFIELFCQYPEGFLEAQAKKEEEKKKQQKDKEQNKESEKGKGKGKGKRKRDEGYCCILLLITLTILKCNLLNPFLKVPIVTNSNFLLIISIHCHETRL